MTPARQLVYSFVELPYISRLEIATIIGVFRGEESEVDFHVAIFLKAQKENRLDELRELINKANQ
jgi:acetolactate synthase small subunit